MKSILLTLFIIITSLTVNAQDARSILDKAASVYNNGGGIRATFILNSKHSSSNDTYSYDGVALLKGNKFRIDIPDAITWFNGSTQWVYLKETDEVNISSPTESDLQNISPSYLFNVYKTGYKIKYIGEKQSNGATLIDIELTPEKQNSDLKKAIISVNKATNMFSVITLTDRSGMTNALIVKNIVTKLDLPESTFVFNKNDFPQAEIIDLR